jgi:RNA ligase, DRB0094 family
MAELIKEGRKLVTIRKINAIEPIEGADMIVKATVDGWDVVVKKGEFEVGQYCVFLEIDSFVPVETPTFAFLTGSSDKIDEAGVRRFRLRTKKLRGVVSQGLALPVSMFSNELYKIGQTDFMTEQFGKNLSINAPTFAVLDEKFILSILEESRYGIEEFLNVTKYERPDERNGGTGAQKCKSAGNFPITIPKTDEDRVQNIFGKYSQTMKGVGFRKSLKLDGSSQTIAFFSNPDFFVEKVDEEVRAWNEETQELEIVEVKPYPFQWEDGQIAICSRNLALKFDAESHFWKAALKDDIPQRLKEYCVAHDRQLAIQGECMGMGIQGNREELTEHTFFAFRVWDIDNKCFFDDAEFQEFCALLGLTVVPQGDIVYFFDEYESIKDALASADHASIKHKICEGDVYKSVTKVNGVTVHFKVINNKFLLKCED